MNEVENAIELLILATKSLLDGYLHNPSAVTKEQVPVIKEQAELVYRLAFDAMNVADIADALEARDFIRRIERIAEDVETRQPHLMLVDAGKWYEDTIAELRKLMEHGITVSRTAPSKAIESAKEHEERIKVSANRAGFVELKWSEPVRKADAAKLYNIEPRTLNNWIRDGNIEFKPVNSHYLRLRLDEYERLLTRQNLKAEPERTGSELDANRKELAISKSQRFSLFTLAKPTVNSLRNDRFSALDNEGSFFYGSHS